MKKTLLIAFSAAFLASPLLACDAMKGDSYHKSDTKASVSQERKAKMVKGKAKTAKPVAAAASSEKKI
jgi:hypothetical protein